MVNEHATVYHPIVLTPNRTRYFSSMLWTYNYERNEIGMRNENDNRLRKIDEFLLDLGLVKRARRLGDFLDQYLKDFEAEIVQSSESPNEEQGDRATQFGQALVRATKDYLADERGYKLNTNWNCPQEEEEICRRIADLGKAYYLGPKDRRDEVVQECLGSFTHLPMPIEELADEERLFGKHATRKNPQDLRPWYKIEKTARVINLEGAMFDPPVRIRRHRQH